MEQMKVIKQLLPYVIALYRKKEACVLLDVYGVEHEIPYEYPMIFLHYLCYQYGSSLKSRRKFAISLLKIRQKIPVLVNDRDMIFFFPTSDISKKECIWLTYHKIIKVQKDERGSIICFEGGMKLLLGMEARSIRRQIQRCKKITAFIS